jgi:hypothetical protein
MQNQEQLTISEREGTNLRDAAVREQDVHGHRRAGHGTTITGT